MTKKHKLVYWVLNYIEHLVILITSVTGFVSISDFVSSLGIPIGIMCSAIRLKVCLFTAGIKKYKSIIKKEKKKLDKIVLLTKSKINSIEILTFKTLVGFKFIHDEFALINNVPREVYDRRKLKMINKSYI